MEQATIDFLVKASELILHNRLPPTPPLQGLYNTLLNPNPTSFQLCFNQKFNFSRYIPLQWDTKLNKLLVIEFHVHVKSSNTKFLAEQWIFDINQIGNTKANETIDSVQTLYKKLSVLLRTISSLTVTLPLYYKIINKEKTDNSASDLYTIEHTINFTRHTLSPWHPAVHEGKDLSSYTGPELVLPGRVFSFKVNYSRSLSFLYNTTILHDITVTTKNTSGHQHSLSDSKKPNTSTKHLTLTRRSCSDNYDKASKHHLVPISFYDPPPVLELEESNWDSESSRLEKADVVTTLHKPGNFLTSNFALRVTTGLQLLSDGAIPRPRLKTMDFGRVEDTFRRNIDRENRSPNRMALYQMDEDGSGYQAFRKISEDFEQKKLKLCTNPRSIEKIIQQSDDDKLSELIHSIEELKNLSGGIERSRQITSHWMVDKVFKEDREGRNRQFIQGKGLRFEMISENKKKGHERSMSPLEEINELKGLYLEIKRSNSME